MNWVVQFDKEFIQKLGRKEMRRYGVRVKFTGYAYVEVDCPNGEDPEEYAIDILFHYPIEAWSKQNYSSIHLHGHTHGRLYSTDIAHKYRYDVGVDSNNYMPISITQVMEKIGFK